MKDGNKISRGNELEYYSNEIRLKWYRNGRFVNRSIENGYYSVNIEPQFVYLLTGCRLTMKCDTIAITFTQRLQ